MGSTNCFFLWAGGGALVSVVTNIAVAFDSLNINVGLACFPRERPNNVRLAGFPSEFDAGSIESKLSNPLGQSAESITPM